VLLTYCRQVSSKDVESRVLRLTVYEVDRHKRHVIVGHALFPLRDYDVSDGSATSSRSLWKDLEREVTEVMYPISWFFLVTSCSMDVMLSVLSVCHCVCVSAIASKSLYESNYIYKEDVKSYRGVAKNLFRRGQNRGTGDRSPPAGSRVRALAKPLEAENHMLKTTAIMC